MSGTNGVARYARDMEGDDDYYMEKMEEILDAPPNNGPPKHPGKLLDHIYIGNQDNAEDYDLLPAIGITHVLNCAGTRTFDLTKSRYPPKLGITGFLMMPAEDYEEFDIMQYFPEAITFLERAKAAGGRALVHCNLGVNRSGAISAAYLMTSQKKPLLKVISDLKDKRSVVLCNVGFRRQLLKYARARGLLDPVEETPKKEKKEAENGVKEEPRNYVNGITNGYEALKKEWNDSARIEENNNDDYFRNSDRNFDIEERPTISSKDYYSLSGKPYRSTSRKLEDDFQPDDNLETELERSTSALKAQLAAVKSRLPVSNGYAPAGTSTASTLGEVGEYSRLSSTSSGYQSSTGCSPYINNSSSSYNSYSPSSVIKTLPSLGVQASVRAREVSPVYTSISCDSRRAFSADRILSDFNDGADFSSIETPATDSFRMSSRSYLDSAGSSENTSDISSVTGNSLYDSTSYRDSILPSYNNINLPITSSVIPSVDLFPETTSSIHPLLAKPIKSYATCNSENFKTTVKPRSYYYKKVVGRVPRYSDMEEMAELDAISDAYRNHVGLDSKSSNSSGRNYRSSYDTSSLFNSSGDYPVENSYGSYSRPSLSTGTGYRTSRDYHSQSPSSYTRSSSLSRSTSRPMGNSAYASSSLYKPNYGSKAGYIKDLEADIEAYNGATFGMMSGSGNGLGNVRTRVVPPRAPFNSYDDSSLYGW